MSPKSISLSAALAVAAVGCTIASASALPTLSAGHPTTKRAPTAPIAFHAPRATTVSCRAECLPPTGKYMVCRSNFTRQIVSRRLIDINACMH